MDASGPSEVQQEPADQPVKSSTPRQKRAAAPRKRKASPAPDAAKAGKPKKEKKAKQPKPVIEKRVAANGRTVRYSVKASVKTLERMARALPGSGHRLYLLDRKTVAPLGSEGGPAEEFVVLGATANVYTVRLSRTPSCTCPDSAKGNLCKHHLFVMLRVLRLARDDPMVWQKALLTPEIEEVLGGVRSKRAAPVDDAVLAQDAVLQQYRKMSGTGNEAGPSSEDDGGLQPGQRPIEGDCPICYDELKAGSSSAADKIVWCAACGNNVHAECFDRWTRAKQAAHAPVSCVWCRATPWVDGSNPQGTAATETDSGYVNLKAFSDEHRSADASLAALYGERAQWIGRGRRRW